MDDNDLEEGTAPRAIKKRFVPLTDGFSLQVKAFTPTNEIKFVLMKLVDGDGWTPIIWIAVPAEQGPALLKALGEVLENKEEILNGVPERK